MQYGYPHETLGAQLRMFRSRTKLSQTAVAPLVGVARESVKHWERGQNKPTVSNLKNLIELYIQHNGFTAGSERTEIENLWQMVNENVAFDEEWFTTIYNTYSNPKEPGPVVEQEEPLPEPVVAQAALPVNTALSPNDQTTNQAATMPGQFAIRTPGPSIFRTVWSDGSTDLKSQERQRMLDYVQSIWIRGVLRHAIHGTLQLELREQPDAVIHPLGHASRNVYQTANLLLAASSLEELFDEAHGKLLILGEPGAGKTILLLKLMNALIERARLSDAYPMPVLFQLASWGEKRLPIMKWLVEMLSAKYQIPHKLGQKWIEEKQILPLFDGIDEVAPEQRGACLEAINDFLREHGLVPTVITSRSDGYLQLPGRLLLHNAVVIQPLTKQQIYDYLEQQGEGGKMLQVALNRDPALRTLVTTPLMLNVLALAYQGQGQSPEGLHANNVQDAQRRIFATYVQRMLQHRSTSTRYKHTQTIRWLHWLAQQLKLHNLSSIYLEDMQCYQLIPGAPQPLTVISVFMFVAQFVALDVGGLGLNQMARRQGLPVQSYARIVAYCLIGITLVTITYSGIEHAVPNLDPQVTVWVEVTLVIARSVMTVLYGQAIHSLKAEEHIEQDRRAELEQALSVKSAQLDTLTVQFNTEVNTLTAQLNTKNAELDTLRVKVNTLTTQIDTKSAEPNTKDDNTDRRKIVRLDQAQDGTYESRIRALLTSEPGLSGREIARRIGCSIPTACNWKRTIEEQVS